MIVIFQTITTEAPNPPETGRHVFAPVDVPCREQPGCGTCAVLSKQANATSGQLQDSAAADGAATFAVGRDVRDQRFTVIPNDGGGLGGGMERATRQPAGLVSDLRGAAPLAGSPAHMDTGTPVLLFGLTWFFVFGLCVCGVFGLLFEFLLLPTYYG